jgi:hypothetical protein
MGSEFGGLSNVSAVLQTKKAKAGIETLKKKKKTIPIPMLMKIIIIILNIIINLIILILSNRNKQIPNVNP